MASAAALHAGQSAHPYLTGRAGLALRAEEPRTDRRLRAKAPGGRSGVRGRGERGTDAISGGLAGIRVRERIYGGGAETTGPTAPVSGVRGGARAAIHGRSGGGVVLAGGEGPHTRNRRRTARPSGRSRAVDCDRRRLLPDTPGAAMVLPAPFRAVLPGTANRRESRVRGGHGAVGELLP